MRSTRLLFVALVALYGCTTPIAPQIAQRVLAADIGFGSRITVTRDAGMFGSACSFHVAIDRRDVVILDPRETASIGVAPGSHQIAVSNSAWCGGGLQYLVVLAREGMEKIVSVGSTEQSVIVRDDGERPFR